MDTVYVTYCIVAHYAQFNFNLPFDAIKDSRLMRKIKNCFNYSLDAISPMMLVYISADRFMLIRYNNKALRKISIQLIYYSFIFLFNAVYYVPVAVFRDLVNYTNASCGFVSEQSQLHISLFNFLNLIRSILIFNALAFQAIFLSRNIIIKSQKAAENKKIMRCDAKICVNNN